MKKKIAVFANGWNSENLNSLMAGMNEGIGNEDIDLFVFLAHLSFAQSDSERRCEQAIFEIPNLKDFDGAVVYGASLNFKEIIDYLYDQCSLAGIPTVSVGLEKEDTYYVGIDSHEGMKSLVEHIITEHNAKNILFIGGDKDNKDSNERLNILRNTMAEHNLVLEDDNIYYSDWEPSRAMVYIQERLSAGNSIPDAIVCANDLLAIFITYGMEAVGYSCPDDILVTGFDYLKEGQRFYPSISSVKQDYYRLGIAASEVFMAIFENKSVAKSRIIPCEFIPGESCGCLEYRDDNLLRKLYLREFPRIKAYEDYKIGRMHHMDRAIMESENFEALPQKIQDIFLSSNGREGKTFYILMDPQFKELSYKDIGEMPAFSFAEDMRVIVAKEDGNPVLEKECSIDKLLPGYSEETIRHMYVFMPIYIEQYVYGYIVMADNFSYFEEMFYYKLVKQFREDLIIYRKNLQLHELNTKLNELMQTDALTQVKNRAAYENELADIKHMRETGVFENFAVAMFDINRLKEINDTYGHEAGDEYIKNCCTFICDYFKHSPVYRIGGDEFVVLIKGADYKKRKALIEAFKGKILAQANDSALPVVERVSIATGMVDVDSSCNDIDDAINQADELMYINKKEMKMGMR